MIEYEGVEYHIVAFEFGPGYDCVSGCGYGLLCTITSDAGRSDSPVSISNDVLIDYNINTRDYCGGNMVVETSFEFCDMPAYHLPLMESPEFQEWSHYFGDDDFCRLEFQVARAYGVIP
jgi:hypothetical protein